MKKSKILEEFYKTLEREQGIVLDRSKTESSIVTPEIAERMRLVKCKIFSEGREYEYNNSQPEEDNLKEVSEDEDSEIKD